MNSARSFIPNSIHSRTRIRKSKWIFVYFCLSIISQPFPATCMNVEGRKESSRSSKKGREEKKVKNADEISRATPLLSSGMRRERPKKKNLKSNEAIRRSWKRTFDDIKLLVAPSSHTNQAGGSDSRERFGRWKSFLDERSGFDAVPPSQRLLGSSKDRLSERSWSPAESPKQSNRSRRERYDGFTTWEKRLQQWADDVSDYLSEPSRFLDDLGNGEVYPLSSYGIPTSSSSNSLPSAENAKSEKIGQRSADMDGKPSVTSDGSGRNISLKLDRSSPPGDPAPKVRVGLSTLSFAPRPVQRGEPVVSSTDLSDKSKNIWIVTTAALPWMTGTAVNPLLRAAYMCAGRSQEGGSVTILLPWLERQADQERVYGKEKAFANRSEQEQFVREWLRTTADMKEASSELRIRWYTAWQERAENSIYSMGDITSLIPVEEADICVSGA